MLNISPPNYQHCPFCGKKLSNKIEEYNNRKHCFSCNWTYYPHVAGSVGAIVIRGSKILMVKRNRKPYKGTWMFPAGFINYGEHPEETLYREIKEETGLEIKNYKFHSIVQSIDDPRAPGHFLILYKVSIKPKKLKNLDPDENTDLKWIPLSENPMIGWQTHQKIYKQLQTSIIK